MNITSEGEFTSSHGYPFSLEGQKMRMNKVCYFGSSLDQGMEVKPISVVFSDSAVLVTNLQPVNLCWMVRDKMVEEHQVVGMSFWKRWCERAAHVVHGCGCGSFGEAMDAEGLLEWEEL